MKNSHALFALSLTVSSLFGCSNRAPIDAQADADAIGICYESYLKADDPYSYTNTELNDFGNCLRNSNAPSYD